MSATWFQGSATDFVKASCEGFENGVSILHFLGGHTADIVGDRAIAQTKMTTNQRAGKGNSMAVVLAQVLGRHW